MKNIYTRPFNLIIYFRLSVNKFNIVLNENEAQGRIIITNVLGEEVFFKDFEGQNAFQPNFKVGNSLIYVVSINQSPGTYFVKHVKNGLLSVKKLIIQ
jgi:hypothetical protein